nr:MAG TPA: adaptor protein [Caudoviricetes sp.]
MATEIICALIAGVCSIISAIIGLEVKRANELAKKHADLRQKESLLSLRMMDATLQLAVVTSNAVTGHQNNGNVEHARVAAQDVAQEYADFMKETLAHEVSA